MDLMRQIPGDSEREERSRRAEAGDLSPWMNSPHKLAVDAKGYVWRRYLGDDEHPGMWSMAPTNPDNSPIPQPVTYYVPEEPSVGENTDSYYTQCVKLANDAMRAGEPVLARKWFEGAEGSDYEVEIRGAAMSQPKFQWPKGSGWEFRVVWQREGRRTKTQIVQKWETAVGKARSILAMDALRERPEYLAACQRDGREPIPRLVEGPTIQQRHVAPWEDVPSVVITPFDGDIHELAWKTGVDLERQTPTNEESDDAFLAF